MGTKGEHEIVHKKVRNMLAIRTQHVKTLCGRWLRAKQGSRRLSWNWGNVTCPKCLEKKNDK
jgi:hypothetical protein